MKSYNARLQAAIPGGSHTYSRGADQFPSNAPPIILRGKGNKVFDTEGKSLLDYGMGLRSVSLGYAHSSVNRAVKRAIDRGNNLTLPHTLELEAAEFVVSNIPGAEMVKFAKNGSNVTTAAIKLARSFTGKARVLVPDSQPFFSFDDWFVGSTAMKRGIPASVLVDTLKFRYGDAGNLARLLKEHSENVACVIMEPLTSLGPCSFHDDNHGWESIVGPCGRCLKEGQNYLQDVRKLCDDYGVLLIMDEMITGFRYSDIGASASFGVVPDLMTFGKAIANGFSLGFVAGRQEIMGLGSIRPRGMERTFLLSSTHGAEMSSLAAFLEVMKIYSSKKVINHLWAFGAEFRRIVVRRLEEAGLAKFIRLIGPDALLTLEFDIGDEEQNKKARTLFMQEMIANGVLMPWIAPSLAHDDFALRKTSVALGRSLPIVERAISTGDFSFLKGPSVQPVFRKFN